jgi:general secretion pathway protein L
MPTSPADPAPPQLLRLAGAGEDEVRTMLVVPGDQVAIHWLELAGDLTRAQAAAAARLMLADASAEPITQMHVAVGRQERGLTAVALAPNALMSEWVAGDPDSIVPAPLLMTPPETGLFRHGDDYRGVGVAFTAEPELAALLIGDEIVTEIGEVAPDPDALDLRQGVFARRRQWNLDRTAFRRAGVLLLVLAALSLLLQVATIMRYTFAADRVEQEAATVAAAAPAGAPRAGFGPLASLLFDAIRATPNVELGRLDYRPDGSLAVTITVDSPATLALLRQRLEASGLAVAGGALASGGARPSAELELRPA